MSEGFEEAKKVLNHYNLEPQSMTQIGSVYKVITSWGTFGLKQLPIEEERQFHETQSILKSRGISTLTILSTRYGEPLVRAGQHLYYLTPWLENSMKSNYRKWEILIDRLAWLHRRTSVAFPVDSNRFSGGFLSENDASRQTTVEAFIYKAEHQIYPSPFEQRIILLFPRIIADADMARNFDKMQGKKDGETDERIVLCHGKPKLEHIFLSERGPYLINFDHAQWSTPVSDLKAIILSEEMQPDLIIRLYEQYQSVSPLTIDEKRWLVRQILYPESFERLIERYTKAKDRSEIDFIGKLHDLCERRQQLQLFITYLEKEISDEANKTLDPSLEETNIESYEQNEDDHIKRRGKENSSDHLENGEG